MRKTRVSRRARGSCDEGEGEEGAWTDEADEACRSSSRVKRIFSMKDRSGWPHAPVRPAVERWRHADAREAAQQRRVSLSSTCLKLADNMPLFLSPKLNRLGHQQTGPRGSRSAPSWRRSSLGRKNLACRNALCCDPAARARAIPCAPHQLVANNLTNPICEIDGC